jgi:ACR3 family arsenite efflux pump ArsB
MSELNFKKLFGILFTAFIIIIILAFLLVSISQKASIATIVILVGIPLAIRYIFYKLANI